MVYVPTPPRETASPQAAELATRLRALIDEYRRYYPDLSDRDVRDALEAAAGRDATRRRPAALVATLAGLVAFGVGLAVYTGQSGGGPSAGWSVPAVGVAVLVLAVLVAAMRRRR